MFLKYYGLSLPADNRETFPLKELTVKQDIIVNERRETMPVKRKNINEQSIKTRHASVGLGSRSCIVWLKLCSGSFVK